MNFVTYLSAQRIKRTFAQLVLSLLVFGVLMPGSALAQSRLALSRSSDFSTQDRRFTTEDVVYLQVTAANLDPTALEENVFTLKPKGEGKVLEGAFTNHFDGTFSTEITLSDLVGKTTAWELEVELQDSDGHVFEQEAHLVIRGLATAPEAVVLRGTVEATGAGTITLGGRTIQVVDRTVIRAAGRSLTPADLLDAHVIVRARPEQNGGLVAHLIVMPGADAGALQVQGPIARVDAITGTLWIRNFEVQFGEATLIRNKAGALLSASDLLAGQFVVVQADRMDQDWVAAEVLIRAEAVGDGV